MQGDKRTDMSYRNRAVLGDLTNRQLKRGVSLILGNSGLKSGNGHGENVDGNSRSEKQVCLGPENLVKEKCKTKQPDVGSNDTGVSLSTDKHVSGDSLTSSAARVGGGVGSTLLSLPHDTVKFNLLNGGSVHRLNTQSTEVGDVSRDTCLSTCTGTKKDFYHVEGEYQKDKEGVPSVLIQSNDVDEGSDIQRCRNEEKDLVGKLGSSKSGLIEWSRLPRSEGSIFMGLERCTGLKGSNFANLNTSDDLLKSCSCTFCLKAAYIWSDLHYQDIKGRIGALKKSQKEANILAQRSKHQSQGNSNKSKQEEVDLSSQWTSLFHHMEDLFAKEESNLQAGFMTLKDLRENCKTNLEMNNGVPSEKH